MSNSPNTIIFRILNLCLLLFFSCCYTEWQGGKAFIFQMQYKILTTGDNLLTNLFHPVIATGLIGELILIYAMIASKPNRIINFIGIVLLGLVVLLFLLVGILSKNPLITAWALPYLITAILFVVYYRRQKRIYLG